MYVLAGSALAGEAGPAGAGATVVLHAGDGSGLRAGPDGLDALVFSAEARRPPSPGASPGVAPLAEVAASPLGGGTVEAVRRDLGRAGGSRLAGLKHCTVAPGKLGVPPHCHAAEDELFVVLEGEGAALIGDDEHPVGPGHVVARPAGSGVAHSFRAGSRGLVFLAYGTRVPDDVTFYPRSGKIFWRGVGLIGRVEPLGYWDGEE